jgi:transposase InsO family protein
VDCDICTGDLEALMSHRNAPLTPTGRLRLARCVVEEGWPLRRAAERFQVAVTTAKRWADRYRASGEAGMVDRSSRPRTSPRRTSPRTERRIVKLRVARRWGPARIAYLLGLHPSTVHRVLTRYRLARLTHLDRATGRVIRRYEHAAPGDLIHVDIKKLGNIPDGGGHRVHGRAVGGRNSAAHRDPHRPRALTNRANLGYSYLHNAVDDHSRLAYTEILPDETKHTATAFWGRAYAFFATAGITVVQVLTDNGSCYRSHLWRDTLTQAGITHKRTRPYRPQTNGKVERFNRTLLDEWAYNQPYQSENRTPRSATSMAAHLQSPPRPHRTPRQTTRQPCPQPHGSLQLVRLPGILCWGRLSGDGADGWATVVGFRHGPLRCRSVAHSGLSIATWNQQPSLRQSRLVPIQE